MNNAWESEFQGRMRSFEATQPGDGMSVSLKVRVTAGCFHREHSPHAYALIDTELAAVQRERSDFEFREHESGPELLALVTAGLGLATSILNLVVTIIGARRRGIERGDHPSEPIELIVRRIESSDSLREERVLRIDHRDAVDRALIKALLDAALEGLADEVDDEDR